VSFSFTSFLSQQVFHEPATLSSCGHSFCKACIDAHCSNHTICPCKSFHNAKLGRDCVCAETHHCIFSLDVRYLPSNLTNAQDPGCNMSTSVRGRGASFRVNNPQLSQTVESLQKIIRSLNSAPDHWWMSQSVVNSILEMKSEKEFQQQKQLEQQLNNDDYDNASASAPFDYRVSDDDHSDSHQSVGRFRPGRKYRDQHEDESEEDDDDDDDENIVDLQAGEDFSS
jgi:hypothetical protein